MKSTKEIYLLGKGLNLITPASGFQPGLDSVMLAAACPAEKGENILDLGCGIGSAGLCILTRVPDTTLTGIDIQDHFINLAQENAALNGFTGRTTFTRSDITAFNDTRFNHVICNPPFLEDGAHIPSPNQSRALANGHVENTTLQDWVTAAFNAVKSGGSLTVIHRADHIDQIIRALGKSFGATEIIPLWPKQGTYAKRVIVRTIKHRKTSATMHPGIVIHEESGEYTPSASAILRETKAL